MLNPEQAHALEKAFEERLASTTPPNLPHEERNRISQSLTSLRLQEGRLIIIVDVAREDIGQLQYQVDNFFFWAKAIGEADRREGRPSSPIFDTPKSQHYHLLRECLQDRSLEVAVWRAGQEDSSV